MRIGRLVSVAGVLLFGAPFSACCRNGIQGINGTLVIPPVDFGTMPMGTSKTLPVTITNKGTASVQLFPPVTITGDKNHAFSATLASGITLQIGQAAKMDVTYAPKAEETDDATASVNNDTGTPATTELKGVGGNACAGVICNGPDGGSDIGMDGGWACPGSCQIQNGKGVCVYGGACAKPEACITQGSCNVTTGACEGPNDCQAGLSCVDGGTLTGFTETCNPGWAQTHSQECLTGQQTTVTCDCGCEPGPPAHCIYQWDQVSSVPGGGVPASVWASGKQPGDLWLSVITGTAILPSNVVYQQVNGTWNKIATIQSAQHPICSGPGCGLALSGSSDSDVYGVNDCTTVVDGGCGTGAAWHWTGDGGEEEPFKLFAQNSPDWAFSTVLDIQGTGVALNIDPTGPEIMEGNPAILQKNQGDWGLEFNTHWGCQTVGSSLWGSSLTDIFVAGANSGCQSGNPVGVIAHFNGSSLDSSFSLGAGEAAVAMWGSSDNDIWAVGTHRWHYANGAWTVQGLGGGCPAPQAGQPPTCFDYTLWGNGTDYFAAGNYTELYHYTTQGGSWQEECIYPGYQGAGATVNSFAYDGQNVYATASVVPLQTGQGQTTGLVERCPDGVCK